MSASENYQVNDVVTSSKNDGEPSITTYGYGEDAFSNPYDLDKELINIPATNGENNEGIKDDSGEPSEHTNLNTAQVPDIVSNESYSLNKSLNSQQPSHQGSVTEDTTDVIDDSNNAPSSSSASSYSQRSLHDDDINNSKYNNNLTSGIESTVNRAAFNDEDWVCQCGTSNSSHRTNCYRCKMDKQDAKLRISKPTYGKHGAADSSGSNSHRAGAVNLIDDWRCKKCNGVNAGVAGECKHCDAPRCTPTQPKPPGSRADSWDCNRCGHYNYQFRDKCQKCSYDRPSKKYGSKEDGGFHARTNTKHSYQPKSSIISFNVVDPNSIHTKYSYPDQLQAVTLKNAHEHGVHGDWFCPIPDCVNHNYSNRHICKRCNIGQPTRASIEAFSYFLLTGNVILASFLQDVFDESKGPYKFENYNVIREKLRESAGRTPLRGGERKHTSHRSDSYYSNNYNSRDRDYHHDYKPYKSYDSQHRSYPADPQHPPSEYPPRYQTTGYGYPPSRDYPPSREYPSSEYPPRSYGYPQSKPDTYYTPAPTSTPSSTAVAAPSTTRDYGYPDTTRYSNYPVPGSTATTTDRTTDYSKDYRPSYYTADPNTPYRSHHDTPGAAGSTVAYTPDVPSSHYPHQHSYPTHPSHSSHPYPSYPPSSYPPSTSSYPYNPYPSQPYPSYPPQATPDTTATSAHYNSSYPYPPPASAQDPKQNTAKPHETPATSTTQSSMSFYKQF